MAEQVEIIIGKASDDADFRTAARIMATTEPWITLGRTEELIHANIIKPQLEVYVATVGEDVVGVVIMAINVTLIKGYISALAVHRDFRSQGIGTQLLRFAQQRIFRESPNVFICASSFNERAQRLYAREGFERIGELKDLIVPGHSEILHRKTRGAWSTFTPARKEI